MKAIQASGGVSPSKDAAAAADQLGEQRPAPMKAKEGAPIPGGEEGGDIESGITGGRPLCPKMTESPVLRRAFIFKVFAAQIPLMVAVFVVFFVFVGPISKFFLSTTAASRAVTLIVAFSTLFVLGTMFCYRHRHPVNWILLGILTICYSANVGIVCSRRGVVSECAFLTASEVLNTFVVSCFIASYSPLPYSRPSGCLQSSTSPSS